MQVFLSILLFSLVLMQGMIMVMDEFVFHRRRGLPPFERWGHVADTSLFLLALLVPAFLTPTPTWLAVYGGLAFASCVFITKDEWIHASACSGAEQWCHALLFVLHGPILLTTGLIWFLQPHHPTLKMLPPIILVWGLYQHLYWNVYHDRKHSRTRGEQSVLRRPGRTLVQ
ncbi:hypothetical protein [Oligoflexus tunisiensis]|uniref:hypothetical protein n=1 Tax=Oligoflexus tunisiensis TaxID=708132 RepID=UPI000AA24B4E|nr:hypothetical protein [Oligoflexus tunisiensis]